MGGGGPVEQHLVEGTPGRGETAGLVPASGILTPDLLLRTLADDLDEARARYRELVDEAVVRLGRRRADEAWWRAVERAAAETRETG